MSIVGVSLVSAGLGMAASYAATCKPWRDPVPYDACVLGACAALIVSGAVILCV